MEIIKTERKIPTIDFARKDLKPGTKSWLAKCKEVHDALEEYGCFVAKLSDEDTCMELHNKIFSPLMDQLFDFPQEIKERNMSNKPFRGYYSSNVVTETLGFGDANNPEEVRKFAKIFWPDGNDHFSETAYSCAKVVTGLDQMVMRMIFDYYGVEIKYCDSVIESMDYVLKFAKYKLEPEAQPETYMALPEHADLSFTTIIHQNDVNGLEIKTKDGEWIPFDRSSPSSFVVMACDGLQVWSNDRIKHCKHRVIVSGNKVRYSLLLFAFNNGIISVPEELVDEEHPLCYKPLNHPEYVASQYANKKARVCLKSFCGI